MKVKYNLGHKSTSQILSFIWRCKFSILFSLSHLWNGKLPECSSPESQSSTNKTLLKSSLTKPMLQRKKWDIHIYYKNIYNYIHHIILIYPTPAIPPPKKKKQNPIPLNPSKGCACSKDPNPNNLQPSIDDSHNLVWKPSSPPRLRAWLFWSFLGFPPWCVLFCLPEKKVGSEICINICIHSMVSVSGLKVRAKDNLHLSLRQKNHLYRYMVCTPQIPTASSSKRLQQRSSK